MGPASNIYGPLTARRTNGWSHVKTGSLTLRSSASWMNLHVSRLIGAGSRRTKDPLALAQDTLPW
jgi:hypothetical protein